VTDKNNQIEITNEGFQFLLQDRKTQIWIVLQQYLENLEKNQLIKSEVLQFLFELSFMESGGKGYVFHTLTKTQKVFVEDLTEFGIIYQRTKDRKKELDNKSRKFYPTSFSIGLIYSGDDTVMDWNIKDQGNIILETNYKLYAYTSSPLEIAILSIFVQLQYRTPNLVVGMLTRESVREALTSGITSKQVFFLSFN
jgi:transcription initiation factor TFIIH subunit 4